MSDDSMPPRVKKTAADDLPEHPGPPPQIVRTPAVITEPTPAAPRRNWMHTAEAWLGAIVGRLIRAIPRRRFALRSLLWPVALIGALIVGRWSAVESESHRNRRAEREGRAVLAGGAAEWKKASREGQYWACSEDVMRRKPEMKLVEKADELRAQSRHLLADVDYCYSLFEKNGRTSPTPFAEAVKFALLIEGDDQKTADERAKRQSLQDALELLISAARGNKGLIQVNESPRGTTITAGKGFCNDGSEPREVARWKEALERLNREDLIELASRDFGGRSVTYERWRVTAAGYRLADQAQ
jgi:hypothetical protein